MVETKTKMAFYDIQEGNLAIQTQEAFEDAQKQAQQYGEPAKVKLEIIVHPPEKTGKFGQVQFKVSKSFPAYKSIPITTQLNQSNGLIISDGDSIADIMQESLKFKDPSIHEIKNDKVV